MTKVMAENGHLFPSVSTSSAQTSTPDPDHQILWKKMYQIMLKAYDFGMQVSFKISVTERSVSPDIRMMAYRKWLLLFFYPFGVVSTQVKPLAMHPNKRKFVALISSIANSLFTETSTSQPLEKSLVDLSFSHFTFLQGYSEKGQLWWWHDSTCGRCQREYLRWSPRRWFKSCKKIDPDKPFVSISGKPIRRVASRAYSPKTWMPW